MTADPSAPMTDTEMDAIRERLAAGSKGAPWFWEVATHRRWASVMPSLADEPERFIAQCVDDDLADFIAHAPTDVAALLAEVDRLTGWLGDVMADRDRLQAELDCTTVEWSAQYVNGGAAIYSTREEAEDAAERMRERGAPFEPPPPAFVGIFRRVVGPWTREDA